jgi:uncharacterized protein YbjT (DUF2867 family)
VKVLAVGAAGSSAGMVIPALVRRGVEVRGLVHDTSKEQLARQAGATETVVADLGDLDAITTAADGVDGVFGVIPAFAADEAALGVNIVRAAVRAGARKVVFSSVYHPSLTALSNHRSKQPAEAALYESDLIFTILQPAMFMQQLVGAWRSAKQAGVITAAYSADSRMSYVDYRDVAEVAAAAFTDDRLDYGTFELAAPGMYTRHDLARLMAEALGRNVSAETTSFEQWAEAMGMPPGPLRDGLATMTDHYDAHGFHGGNSLVLETLLGRAATTVPDYVAELARADPVRIPAS